MINKSELSHERVIRISLEDDLEWETVRDAYIKMLEHFQGNVSQLRRRLGIPHQSLYHKFRKYEIVPDEIRRQFRN